MGYSILGFISPSCKKEFQKNIGNVVKMAVSGIQSKHPRVRWDALMATGMLINELSPDF